MSWMDKVEALVSAGFSVEFRRVLQKDGKLSQHIRCMIDGEASQNHFNNYACEWGLTAQAAFRKAERNLARGVVTFGTARRTDEPKS